MPRFYFLVVIALATHSHSLHAQGFAKIEESLNIPNEFYSRTSVKAVSENGRYVALELGYFDGQTVIGWGDRATGQVVVVGDIPEGDTSGSAFGISRNGEILVGGGVGPYYSEAVTWSSATGLMQLGDLPGGSHSSYGIATSDNGDVVVGTGAGSGIIKSAFRWTEAGGMVGLGTLPHWNTLITHAGGVSGDGSTVIGFALMIDDPRPHGFVWTEQNGMTEIPPLAEGATATPLSISGNGMFMGGWSYLSTSEIHPVIWGSTLAPKDLGLLDGWSSGAVVDLSNDGKVAIGTYNGTYDRIVSASNSFIWTEAEGMRAMDDYLLELYPDFEALTEASSIVAQSLSDDGTTLLLTLNLTESYLVSIPAVPEPATFGAIAGCAILGFVMFRQRRKRS